MSKSSKLYRLMSEDLPTLTYQRRLSYRTTQKEVLNIFRIINREVFNDKLPMPEIEVKGRTRDYWGLCGAKTWIPSANVNKSTCRIILSDKWFCKQWLICTLAHEMCHQYQWDIDGKKRMREGLNPIMSHGPSFFLYKKKLARYGIPLKRAYSKKSWFTYQNLFKC